MNRKNFQNENSCHDMDVAKVRKMQKKCPQAREFLCLRGVVFREKLLAHG